MKPAHTYFPHATFDMTECKVHVITAPDGTRQLVAFIPKASQASEPREVSVIGGTAKVRQHVVTEWEQVSLATLGPAS